MTIRGYVASFYAALAAIASVAAYADQDTRDEGARVMAVVIAPTTILDAEEIDPGAAEMGEAGDLPAYLTESEADLIEKADATQSRGETLAASGSVY